MMKIHEYACTLCLLAVLLFSCAEQDAAEQKAKEVYLTLNLSIPGASTPPTRVLTADDEAAVQSLKVLVFKESADGVMENATFAYSAPVTKLSVGSVTAMLRKSTAGEKYRLLLLANAGNPTRQPTTADTYSTVCGLYVSDYTSTWSGGLPMLGASASAQLVTEETSFGTFTLKRAVARVDVGLGITSTTNGAETASGLSNFALTSVAVYNRGSKVYINGGSSPKVKGPLQYAVGSSGKLLVRDIYLPEAKNTTDATGATALPQAARCCLVLGGRYDANGNGNTADDAIGYYRVDFVDANQKVMDVVRNKRYVVNVKTIGGAGFATADEAFNNPPVNITVSIHASDVSLLPDVTYDGQTYFSCGTKAVTLSRAANSSVSVPVSSSVPASEWVVSNPGSAKITVTAPSGSATTGNLVFTALGVGGSTGLTAGQTVTVSVKVKKLTVAFVVRQSQQENVVVEGVPGIANGNGSGSWQGSAQLRPGNLLPAANSFILATAGTYNIDATIKGNGEVRDLPDGLATDAVATRVPEDGVTTIPATDIASAAVLWETVNTTAAPTAGSIVSNVSVSGGMITFTTGTVEGNAVIAVKNSAGTILWSWHIWRTNEAIKAVPLKEIKSTSGIVIAAEGAIKLMDRNLGALSNVDYATDATKGNLSAGLFYQWGRKDPFKGVADIASNSNMAITPSSAYTAATTGGVTPAEAINNPGIFYKGAGLYYDWAVRNDNSWGCPVTTTGVVNNGEANYTYNLNPGVKTIYDPCPAGWRMAPNYVFANAYYNSSSDTNVPWTTYGREFKGITTSSASFWFPALGCRSYLNGIPGDVGKNGYFWLASPHRASAHDSAYLYFMSYGILPTNGGGYRGNGYSVRCMEGN